MSEQKRPLILTIEEIEQVAESFKDDLTREAKRFVRRKNLEHAWAAFAAEDYVDQFVTHLRILAGSDLGRVTEPKKRAAKKRIRKIYISEVVRNAHPDPPLTPEEQEAQRHVCEVVDASRYKGTPKHY